MSMAERIVKNKAIDIKVSPASDVDSSAQIVLFGNVATNKRARCGGTTHRTPPQQALKLARETLFAGERGAHCAPVASKATAFYYSLATTHDGAVQLVVRVATQSVMKYSRSCFRVLC
jgi:hypothetical protein